VDRSVSFPVISCGQEYLIKLVLGKLEDSFFPKTRIPIESGLIFPIAGSVLVCGREQLLL
jgi:hypothetical protein